ncbi:hypothetical protein EC950943_4116B, partial [Escherichia coli 95.0943]
ICREHLRYLNIRLTREIVDF